MIVHTVDMYLYLYSVLAAVGGLDDDLHVVGAVGVLAAAPPPPVVGVGGAVGVVAVLPPAAVAVLVADGLQPLVEEPNLHIDTFSFVFRDFLVWSWIRD